MPNAAEYAFSVTASSYDQNRSRLIPCFDRFYRWAVDLVPGDAQTILDLGAGTGLLSEYIRARLPNARLHLVDVSEAMLAKARDRLVSDHISTFQVADYSDGTLSGSYDAVVSALSIHHLTDPAKQILFNELYHLLNPGGAFINAEQVLGETDALEARYKALWLEQVRSLGASEQQIEESLFRQQEDRCATVEDQLQWMRSAGFVNVACWFKDGRFAVLAGYKR